MRRSVLVLSVLILAAQPAVAREGFSISLGLGYGFWSLDGGDLSSALDKIDQPTTDRRLLTDELSDGLAVRFAVAYNILGYASVEIGMTGHGWNLSNPDAIGGSGHASLLAHFHPFELFMPDRDFDASVFFGGGYSIVGGGHEDDNLSRGLDGGAIECGLTGRYFITNWFSVGAEMRLSIPIYSRWHVDWDDDVSYSIPDSPSALFFSLLLTTTFHFVAG